VQSAGEYVDVGISGATEKRPELDRLSPDAYRQRFDVIVAWKFDRFAGSVSHLLRALENFQAFGIEFVSLTEGVDASTPTGNLVFTTLGAVAELERSLIAERVKAGLRNARAKGKKLGNPGVNLGAIRIASLRRGGASWRVLCDKTGLTKGTAKEFLGTEAGRKGVRQLVDAIQKLFGRDAHDQVSGIDLGDRKCHSSGAYER
jgi:DNA invertase Pin-like site-specific DNA recombinase